MWPKVYMYIQINDQPTPIKLILHETRVVKDVVLPPTNILQYTIPNSTTTSVGLYVVCYDGSVLELLTIQPPSKKPYPARDFVHGYPNATIQWVPPPKEEVDDGEEKENNAPKSSNKIETATTSKSV
jgi:methionyl-tRNA formyltransferase